MKEYRILSEKISGAAKTFIQKCLNDNSQSGWIFKQIIINESVDEYIIIMERDY